MLACFPTASFPNHFDRCPPKDTKLLPPPCCHSINASWSYLFLTTPRGGSLPLFEKPNSHFGRRTSLYGDISTFRPSGPISGTQRPLFSQKNQSIIPPVGGGTVSKKRYDPGPGQHRERGFAFRTSFRQCFKLCLQLVLVCRNGRHCCCMIRP